MSEFLSVIEWFDDTGVQLVQRIPEEGAGALKLGSVVVVRPNQAAVFFRDGRGLDVLGTGRHMLSTMNIPVLTKLLSLPWGFTSPIRAEVVFVNQKLFTDLGWGTQQPIAYRDAELGLVRLRAFGNYALQVTEPLLFVNRLVGTKGVVRTDEIRDYFRDLILSRLTDYFGENVRSLFDLPSVYNEMSDAVMADLQDRFSSYGVTLENFFITAITPTEDVQRAIDRHSEMAAIGDLDAFLKYQAAQALGASGSQTSGEPGGTAGGQDAGTAGDAMAIGTGAGIGMMLPGMIWKSLDKDSANMIPTQATSQAGAEAVACPSCSLAIAADSRFCHRCGETLVAGGQCTECQKRLPPEAKFCIECGTPVESLTLSCPSCEAQLPEGATFCPGCGERTQHE